MRALVLVAGYLLVWLVPGVWLLQRPEAVMLEGVTYGGVLGGLWLCVWLLPPLRLVWGVDQ